MFAGKSCVCACDLMFLFSLSHIPPTHGQESRTQLHRATPHAGVAWNGDQKYSTMVREEIQLSQQTRSHLPPNCGSRAQQLSLSFEKRWDSPPSPTTRLGRHAKPSATAYDVIMVTSINLASRRRTRLGSRRQFFNPLSTTSATRRTTPCATTATTVTRS